MTTNCEVEKIRRIFDDKDCFSTYRDNVVKQLVECIRVNNDGVITIMLKGGITVEQQVEKTAEKKEHVQSLLIVRNIVS